MSKITTLISVLLLLCVVANIKNAQRTQALAYEFSTSPSVTSAVRLLSQIKNTSFFDDQYENLQQKLGGDLDILWQQKQMKDSSVQEKLESLQKEAPENPQLLASLALVELKKNNTDKAAILYWKAKILDPLLNYPELEELIGK